MSFWMILDDSVGLDELLAGAGAAALAATLAEICLNQAGSQVRVRSAWLGPALRLPWALLRDTGLVFLALWLRLVRGQEPASRYHEEPARFGPDTVEGRTRRSLLIGGLSVAPTRFVVGLDRDRDVAVVHELVPARQGERG